MAFTLMKIGIQSIAMLRNYFVLAFRNLKKKKIYSFINITGLALGIACTLAIGLFVLDEFSYDRFHVHFKDIFRVTEKQKQADGIYTVAVTPGPLARGLSSDFPEVKAATRFGSINGLLQMGRKSLEIGHLLSVDSAFFDIFSFPLVAGDRSHILQSPDEIVLNEATAARFFGEDWASQNIIGQRIELDRKYPLIVSGVIKNAPASSSLEFDALLSFKFEERLYEHASAWDVNSYYTYLQLDAGVDPKSFQQKIGNYLKRYDPEIEQLELQALGDIYLRSSFDFQNDQGRRGDIIYVRVFITVGLIVLLIALLNFINLTTARATERAKSVGVRKVIGAKRSALIVQFLVESFVMTGMAVIAGYVLLQMSLPAINSISGKQIDIPADQPLFWGVLLVFTMLTGFTAGLYPALYISSYRPAKVLKGVMKTPSGKTFRQSLVIGQFALSIILAVITIVIYCQLDYIKSKKLGFDQSRLMYVRLKGNAASKSPALINELKTLPGIDAVSASSATLVDVMTSTTNIEWQGKAVDQHLMIYQMYVDDNFIPATGITLLTGSNFIRGGESDTSSSNRSYIINETAAHRMGYTNHSAIGTKIRLGDAEGEIKAVVSDFHYHSLRKKIDPFVFSCGPERKFRNLIIKTNPGNTDATISGISGLFKRFEPDFPFDYGFVDQDLQHQYNTERQTGDILFLFTVLAMLVSCLGLFGLATLITLQRTKEIGIRKALGASGMSIVFMFFKDFLQWILIAFIIATPIAWIAGNHWLGDFSYRIRIEWWMFASVGVSVAVISLLTVLTQSARASLSNPVNSLRTE